MKKLFGALGLALLVAATVLAAVKAGQHLSLASVPLVSPEEIDRMVEAEEYPEAIRQLRRRLLDDPDSDELRMFLAGLYERNDQPEEAERIYLERIEKRPEDVEARFYLARARYGMNRAREAISMLERVKADAARMASPEASRELLLMAHGLLAEIYMQSTGEYSKAIPEYQRMLKYRPDSPEIRYQLGMAFAYARQYQSAYHEFDQIMREHPDTEIAKYAKNAIQYVRERKNPGRSDYLLDYGR